PTTYKGESMTWMMGRLLSSYDHSGVVIDYFYAANGERKTKSYGTSTSDFELTNYYYEGGRLLREERTTQDGTKNIYYLYDETGVIGFLYDGYQYYYRKNAQGDILSVHCGTDLHATYTYDAWGNCTISFDAAGIGALNPFRYRGYYLDRETGLYYLMTRYYDPEIGRFVNADDVSYLDPETLNGLNLYAYCLNNPVTGYDPKGTWSWGKFWDIFTIVVATVAGIAVGVSTGFSTKNVALGIAAGVQTYGTINNAVNAIYYASSAGESTLNGSSYNERYLTRWERLDYAKRQTKDESYFFNAWRYYSEYSLHMYGWFVLQGFYEEGNDKGLSGIAYKSKNAEVWEHEWDSRWFINVATVLFGILGL
ncbi:MAG: RHS repeat-associated core domain-containing protein, partial [Clostridia bacterium]|nr:RHS repeat-associated core domain-containing protein [Clostridia bacterium]